MNLYAYAHALRPLHDDLAMDLRVRVEDGLDTASSGAELVEDPALVVVGLVPSADPALDLGTIVLDAVIAGEWGPS